MFKDSTESIKASKIKSDKNIRIFCLKILNSYFQFHFSLNFFFYLNKYFSLLLPHFRSFLLYFTKRWVRWLIILMKDVNGPKLGTKNIRRHSETDGTNCLLLLAGT